MRGHAFDSGKGSEELFELTRRAASLLAAVFIMLSLLFSSLLPERTVSVYAALTGHAAPSESLPSPTPYTDPLLSVRLADVDRDVDREVYVRLAGVLPSPAPVERSSGPVILVYHTHDTEAYRAEPGEEYAESGSCRTDDNEYNVYAVGEELCRVLREEYGVECIHADEKHEKPLITTAYSRSLITARSYLEQYPTLKMFIDLHRDGVPDTGFEDDFITVDGVECARMMFVVGTGKSGKSSQTAPDESPDTQNDMPDFESNYALALKLTEKLLSVNGRFMRNIRVKSGKYNQQLSSMSMLVEIGHNANTLTQAKNSAAYLARAIAEVCFNKKGQ